MIAVARQVAEPADAFAVELRNALDRLCCLDWRNVTEADCAPGRAADLALDAVLSKGTDLRTELAALARWETAWAGVTAGIK